MVSSKYLLPLLSIAILSIAASAPEALRNGDYYFPTAYELLHQLSFPVGLLPQGVESYLLKPDGSFEVFLGGVCEFKVSNKYLIKYKRIIKGTVQSGTVTDLKGVSVRVLLLWVPITGVRNTGDDLTFYIGPISKSFPVSDFNESPRCRCGSECANVLLVDS